MSEHELLEAAFARERAAGRMTRDDVEILRRRLAVLALNMTLTSSSGEIPKTVAAVWMIQVQRRRIGSWPTASTRVLTRAERWWTLAASVGLLRVTEETVAFSDDATREYFCRHFFQTRPLDGELLRLAARPAFAPVWREWAREDPTLVDRLLALLSAAPEPPTRTRAATILGYLADLRARDSLMAARGDASTAVRIAATGALAAYGDPNLTGQLARELIQESDALRPPLAVALGKAGEPSVPALLALLEHPNWLVARAAVIGLGWTRSLRAVAALIEPRGTLGGDSSHVVEALVRLGEVALPALIATYNDERPSVERRAGAVFQRLGYINAADVLLDLLRGRCRREPGARFPDLGRALVRQCTADNAYRFREALADPYSEVRLWSAVALAERHDPAAFVPLMTLLRHHDRLTRMTAVGALGQLGDRRAVEPLIAMLEHLETAEVPALPDTGGVTTSGSPRSRIPFAGMMTKIVNDMDRHIVSEALGWLCDSRATAPLLRALERADDVWHRHTIVRALGNIGDPAAIEPLLALVGTAPGHDHIAVAALAHIVDQRTLDGLRRLQLRFPPDTDPGSQIARAIRQLSNQLG